MKRKTKAELINSLTPFTRAYIQAALWSEIDDNQEPLDNNYCVHDLTLPTLEKMIQECAKFHQDNHGDIGDRDCQAGHDFWLTRNGHGVGFWEKSDWPEEAGQRLTKAAHALGEAHLFVVKGKIIQE